ncbi:hypothetical protein L9F63_023983, partial [Diploptera punctata]
WFSGEFINKSFSIFSRFGLFLCFFIDSTNCRFTLSVFVLMMSAYPNSLLKHGSAKIFLRISHFIYDFGI